MDGVAVLLKVMERNASLLHDAEASIQDKVWIYRSESSRNARGVSVLQSAALFKGVQALIQRHNLL